MTPPRSLLVPADDEIEWDPIPPDDEIQWESPSPVAAPALTQEDDGPDLMSVLRDLFSVASAKKIAKGGVRGLMAYNNAEVAANTGAAKGLGSTVLGLGEIVRKGAGKVTGHETPPLGSTADALGLEPEGLAEGLGFGAEQLAEFFGPAVAKAPRVVAAGGKLGTLASMGIEGANSALTTAAQGGDATLGAILGASGPMAGKIAERVSPRVSAWLAELAKKGYGKAIGATTKDTKAVAEKVIPELLKRRFTAMTRDRLANKAGANVAEANAARKTALAQVPMGTTADLPGVVQQLQSLKLKHMVSGPGGKMIPANAEAAATIAKIDSALEHVRATSPQFHNVNKQRAILDNQVTQGGKNQPFGRSIDDTSTLGVTRDVANMERAALAAKSVPLAKANKEFTLWKRTADLLEKEGAAEKAAGSGGRALAKAITQYGARGLAVTGATAAGGKAAALTAGAIVAHDAVRALVQSTGWRTVSAVNKARLADLIASHDVEGITRLVARLSAGTASQMSREKKKREYFYKLRQSEKKPPEATK